MHHPLFIRADASTEIGTGHVMRMLALAQAWQDRYGSKGVGEYGSNVRFICVLLPESLEERLRQEGCDVVRIAAPPGSPDDLIRTLNIVKTSSAIVGLAVDQPPSTINHQPSTATPWVALDGYPFGLAYQRGIRAAGFKLLVVDDYNHLPEYECDILLNQNLGAEEYEYKINAGARLLLGPGYALLRREFRRAITGGERPEVGGQRAEVGGQRSEAGSRTSYVSPSSSTINHQPSTILVTMGGADPHNVSLKVIQALNASGFNNLHVKVLIGAANPHRESLERATSAQSTINYQLINSACDMPSLMQWADLAITAAGSTCLELMALGVPLMAVVIADNQQNIARLLADRDLACNMGWFDCFTETELAEIIWTILHDPLRRDRWIERGRTLVDRRAINAVEVLWTND